MKSVHSFSVVRALIVAISTLSMFSTLAYAQDAVGKFTLPYEVHWGKAILDPGDYKYSIESSGPAACTWCESPAEARASL